MWVFHSHIICPVLEELDQVVQHREHHDADDVAEAFTGATLELKEDDLVNNKFEILFKASETI